MADLNKKPTQKHLLEEVAFMLWETVKQAHLNKHIPGPVPAQMMKAAKDLGAAYAKLNNGATFLDLYTRVVEVQSRDSAPTKLREGDVVVTKGVPGGHAEYDRGTIESFRDRGTANVRWKRARVTYAEDVNTLELAEQASGAWDAEVAAWHFAFWADGSEPNMKWAHAARIRVPEFIISASMEHDEVVVSWHDEGERAFHRDFVDNPPRPVEALVIEPDRKEQTRATKLIKQLYPKARITIVDNAMAAIGNIDTHKYDLILSEVELLGSKDGLAVLEHVRRTQPQLAEHFVFFTASTRANGKVLDKQDAVRGADLRRVLFSSAAASERARERTDDDYGRAQQHSQRDDERARQSSHTHQSRHTDDDDDYGRAQQHSQHDDERASREWWNAAPAPHGTGSSRDSGYVYRWWPPIPGYGYRDMPENQQDLEDCAAAIKKAVAGVQGVGRFGRDKVFISVAWDAFNRYMVDSGQGRPFEVWNLAFFKHKLLKLMRHDLIVLTRADLVGAMPPDLLADSTINDHGATFHFVFDSIEYERERDQRRRARDERDRADRERKRAEYDREDRYQHGHTHGHTAPSSPLEDARATLGFGPDVPLTDSVIKARKKQLAREHHPDLGGSSAMMAKINDAADVLLASLRN